MDGAQAEDLFSTIEINTTFQWVGGRVGCLEVYDVNQNEASYSADLGGSSKYSYETYEDWSGERFRVKSISTRVSRS